MTEIIAQTLSIVGMVGIVSSFQIKNKKILLLFYLSGNFFFSASYFLLSAYAAALLNFICGTLTLVYTQGDKIKNKLLVNGIYYALFTAAYILSFTIFDTPRTPTRFLLELLPLVAMCVMTIGFSAKSSATVRRLGLINSPLWLTYNIIVFSIGGIICECISLTSIIVGIFRHDIKRKTK